MGRRMTIDSVPLNDVVTRSARRSCAAPLTVLTGAILMAAVGHGHLHRDPVLPTSFAQSDPRVAAAEPVAEPPRGEA
jgi:hypothetical protein